MTYLPRSTVYNGLLQRFQNSPIIGTVPIGGARYGIITGSAAEYARFGTAMAYNESGFNTRSTDLNDPGGSFGIFQYNHQQAYGNAYDPNLSMDAFVRDTTSAVQTSGRVDGGILTPGLRFASSTFNRTARDLSGAGAIADGPLTNPDGSAADPSIAGVGGGLQNPALNAPDPNQPGDVPGAGLPGQQSPDAYQPQGNGGGGGAAGIPGMAGGGQAIPINLQVLGPGTTKPIGDWIKEIMKGFGQEAQKITDSSIKTVDTYFSNLLGGVTNWFVRAFLIVLGIIIIAIGLIVLMWDHGGEQVAINVRKAVTA